MQAATKSNISESQVGAVIDKLGFARKYKIVLLAAAIGYFFDAFDNAILGYALPAIAEEFHLDPLTKGLILSAALWGGVIGMIFWGPISEAFGRLFAFRGSLYAFSILTGLTGLATYPLMIGIGRLIAGTGLGGFVPIATGMVSEISPTKYRGRFTSLIPVLFPIGSLAAAFLSLLLLPLIGWRGMFALGAAAIFVAIFAHKMLPESPRWLAAKGRGDDALASLKELGATDQIIEEARAENKESTKLVKERAGVKELLSRRWLKNNVLAWSLWISVNFAYLAVLAWLPSILVDVYHLTIVKSLTYTVVTAGAGTLGRLLGMYLIDKVGRKFLIIYTYTLSAMFCIAFGNVTNSEFLLFFAASFFFFADQSSVCVVAYIPELFPTQIRLIGSVWAAAAGRVAAALAPIMAGALMGIGRYATIWTIFAAVYLITAVLVAMIGPETKGRSLDELYQEKPRKPRPSDERTGLEAN